MCSYEGGEVSSASGIAFGLVSKVTVVPGIGAKFHVPVDTGAIVPISLT